jgi:hypothetical protein
VGMSVVGREVLPAGDYTKPQGLVAQGLSYATPDVHVAGRECDRG